MNKHFLLLLLCLWSTTQAQTWDILDKTMIAWNTDGTSPTNKKWTFSTNTSSGFTQKDVVFPKDSYINITKMLTGFEGKYAFLMSPVLTLSSNKAYTIEVKARANPIDKKLYPDRQAPTNKESTEGYESNQVSIRINNKLIAFYIQGGTTTKNGYITPIANLTPSESDKYVTNTSEWHVYRLLVYPDNSKFDLYIDDLPTPIFEGVPTINKNGTNNFRIGAETYHRCNLDLEYVKMGTGDYCTKSKVQSVSVSSDSHVTGHKRVISVSISTVGVNNGEELTVSLFDKEGHQVTDAVKATVQNNQATINQLIFPSGLAVGKYQLRVEAFNNTSAAIPLSVDYCIVENSPLELRLFPQVTPVGFTIPMSDYLYKGKSNEFIFPSIIDTKEHTINGRFADGNAPLDRYYLFYTPHENPGGMYLATAPTLDGPWAERNTVIDLQWAQSISGNIINTADHISSCQVIWNRIHNKYFMYFHGPNTTTHYATSNNLIEWTFGKSIVNAKDFSAIGAEASYAKVFEHKIPGLDNTYIMMLMIYENGIRSIYWAHSKDGIEWTCNKKPLISPNLDYKKIPGTNIKPSYSGSMGSNVSGPFFMECDGRYFVFFHGSSGNICVAEVGVTGYGSALGRIYKGRNCRYRQGREQQFHCITSHCFTFLHTRR